MEATWPGGEGAATTWFVFGGPRFNSSRPLFGNNKLVSLPPLGIFNKFLFNL